MMLEPEYSKKLEDGKYLGDITDIKITPSGDYTYFEFFITIEGMTIKKGDPANITYDKVTKLPVSKLAIDLKNLGLDLSETKMDTDEIKVKILGTTVQCLLVKDGNYLKVVDGSLKKVSKVSEEVVQG